MNQEVKVQEIEWLSQEAEEALVIVSDGFYSCHTFCQPCHKDIGEIIEEPLLSFGTKCIQLVNEDSVSIRRIEATFRHEIYAKVLDLECEILEVGNIKFELDTNFPKGLTLNSIIRFCCQRIDLF